jgi:uncharacterized membrane protein
MKWLKNIYYSFPIQLLLVSLKRHQLLLVFWVLLFSIIVGRFAISYGVPYLFLDPEYLDHTGYLAFTLVGMGFGAFYVSWNLNCYMQHSYRFTFMARFNKPMGVYFLNNSIVPVAFLINYFVAIAKFQTESQHYSAFKIAFSLVGFTIGFVIILLLTAVYFTFTNRTALSAEAARKKVYKRSRIFKPIEAHDQQIQPYVYVRHYINYKFRPAAISTLEQFHPDTMKLIYRQHHWNALFAQAVITVLILSIGFFMDNPLFQIPTAASVFMFLSLVISLFGVLIYWTGGWATTAIIVFFLFINEVYKIDSLGYQSRAYGLDYSKKAKYDVDAFRKLSSPIQIQKDIQHFTTILENWRKKNSKGLKPGEKPKLIFINVSGGGLRAARFSTAVMMHIDSMMGGTLFDKTFMISGASGGMFAAAYMRELYLRRLDGFPIDIDDNEYEDNISKDLLNPICISILSNDLLVPIHKFRVDSMSYFKDRGYMMERKFSLNTHHVLERRIKDYYNDETSARIPLLMIHTEVNNDSRRFFISPQPVSFLMRPVGKYTTNRNLEIDAIDFCRFFKAQKGENLSLLSALRMNATFPLILPNSVLPTEPETSILDGGALDNLGYEPTFRVMETFKDWINQNTSGVIIIQIRDGARHEDDDMGVEKRDLFSMLTNPFGTIFGNQMSNQDFVIDQKLGYSNEELRGRVSTVSFEYTAQKEEQKAALSFHLTQREKDGIVRAISSSKNMEAFKLLDQSIKSASIPEQ